MTYSDSEGGGKVRLPETRKGFVDVRGKENGGEEKEPSEHFLPRSHAFLPPLSLPLDS